MVHTPLMQTGLLDGHTCPQLPQLLLSLVRLTHVPEQLVCPLGDGVGLRDRLPPVWVGGHCDSEHITSHPPPLWHVVLPPLNVPHTKPPEQWVSSTIHVGAGPLWAHTGCVLPQWTLSQVDKAEP